MEKQDIQTLENKNLILASQNGELEDMKKALENGADIEVKDEDGETPLFQSLYYIEELPINDKDFTIIEFLINSGANVNNNIKDTSALSIASMFCEIRIIELLLKKGANVNVIDNNGHTPLIVVIISHLVFHQIKTEIFISDEKKYQENVEKNQKNIIKLLIKNGADVNMSVKNLSILFYACMFSDIEIIKILIKNGADVNCYEGNMSLLEYVLLSTEKFFEQQIFNQNFGKLDKDKVFLRFNDNRLEIAQLLIDNGAKITHELWFNSILDKKILNNLPNERIVDDKVVTIYESIIEKEYKKSFIKMMNYGNIKIVKFLIKNGADVNIKYNETLTTLDLAFFSSNYEIFKLLVESGADVNLLNEFSLYSIKNKDILRIIINNIDVEKFNELTQINNQKAKFLNSCRLDIVSLKEIKLELETEIDESLIKFQTPIAKVLLSKDSLKFKALIDEGYDVSSLSINELIKENYPFDFIALAVKNGADVNEVEPRNSHTPLISAIRYNDIDVIKLLIAYGAKVDYKTKKGKEVYTFASDLEVIKILLNPIVHKEKSHNPQKLVEILNKFTIAKSNLKHTTHNWDMEQRKGKWKDINFFLEDIREDWKAIDDDLKNISPNLHSTIESFLFNTKLGEKNPESKQECIYSWGEYHLKMGWSSPEFIKWCNENPKESPFNYMLEKSKREVIDGVAIDRFSDVINIFKNEIEIRSDKNQLMEIFFNLEGNLANGFNLDINDSLEGVEFYTDVESFKASLVRIFKMMQERETSPQIKVRAEKFIDKGYIELYLTQIASTTHKEPQEIIKKIEKGDAGDMGYILEKLSSLCDWSIEYTFDEEKSYRINLLDSKTHKITFKEVNPIEGFTHILRFYK